MKLLLSLPKLALFYGILLLTACTIRNTTVAGEQNSLQDTDWMLLSFGDHEVPTAPDARTSYIHFDSKN
ncbi:hypothetical protein FVR03_12810, partial [Pontibacter qinzhouensis]